MVYPIDEETFDPRVTPEFIKEGHLNSIQAFLKRIQDFLGYGGRISDKFGVMVPPGVQWEYTGETAPAGFLLCDGSLYLHDHADYADLFAVIGYKYGEGIGSRFRVPDTRGQFQRGWGDIPTISFVPGNVTTGTDDIDFVGSKFRKTGIPVRFTTDDTLPAPLVINTTYYIISEFGVTCKIATSRALAMAGTQIDITTTGAGTSYVHWYPEDDNAARLVSAPGGADGENLGSWQGDELKAHSHFTVKIGEATSSLSTTKPIAEWWDSGANSSYQLNSRSGEADYCPSEEVGEVEGRPKNLYINHIIKR